MTTTHLLLSVNTSDDFVKFDAYVVTMTPDGKVRNPASDSDLADLRVTAQADRTGTGDWYGYQTEYRDVFAADLGRTEKMVKTLRKVDRAVRKLDAEFGWSDNLPTYLARAAKALGVKSYLIDRGPNGTGKWGHDGHEYSQVDVNTASVWIDGRLAEARK